MVSLFKFILFVLVLGSVEIGIYLLPKAESPLFKLPDGNRFAPFKKNNSLPIFESYFIPQPDFLLASHSATFEKLSDGTLLAFWFAGSREGKPDVKIWSATFKDNHWSRAKEAISPEFLSKKLNIFVNKVGNPVTYLDDNGNLHLFVVSVGLIGGWSASTLNHLVSLDNGHNWQKIDKLILSPFFNYSTLVRTSPIKLQDGGFYLPVYHELMYSYPELLRFNKHGKFTGQLKMAEVRKLMQPSIVVKSDSMAYSFLRNAANNNILYMQTTDNAGISWSIPKPTNLINHNSSLAAIYLDDGYLLMVHNIGMDRGNLVLSISQDGIKWRTVFKLESGLNGEFSYPVIKINEYGTIDVLYTWQRKKIKHVRFNQAWLESYQNKNKQVR